MDRVRFEDLTPGLARERVREVTSADLEAFAAVSGDHNPVHLDEAFAARTRFGGRVAHGMLTGAWISALIAGELPGPGSIYLSQSLAFRRPVRIGDAVAVRVEVLSADERTGRVRLKTEARVGGKLVADGEAEVLAPRGEDEA